MVINLNIGSILAGKYKILRLIGEGGMGVVWLAENIKNKEQVAIKIIKEKFRSKQVKNLLFFKKEADILQGLEHPQVGKLIEFDFSDSHFFIVMEYIEGVTLHEYLDKESHFDIDVFFDIAIQISEIFNYIHSLNILHCDIKPNNIILQQKNNKLVVKILDFGIARLLPLEGTVFTRSIGTCSYLSPEQSGFLRRKVDHRSDLYSIGIIFYHMLAGVLPYVEEDIYKLMYLHIASEPEQISKRNPEVPPILEKIIIKLLSKDIEDRYSDAKALSKDLKLAKERWEAKDYDSDFSLGQTYTSTNKIIPVPFIGRDKELNILKRAFDKSKRNFGSVILVEGESGIGKTHLVDVFQEYVIKNGGIFISANNHEYDQKEPLKSIVTAMDRFIDIISLLPEERKKELIETINKNLGQSGNLIIPTIPGIKRFLTHTQKIENLSDNSERKRFDNILIKTLLALSTSSRAVVLFIDNIQWADLGTLQFIENYIQFASCSNVLIVANVRTPYDTDSEELPYLNEIRNQVETIILPPHERKHVREILNPIVGDDHEKIETLSDAIIMKTGGNIQFIKEVIQLLNKNSYFKNDKSFNITDLNKLSISETQLELIKDTILNIPTQVKLLFSYMAVMGREVIISDLFECFSSIKREDLISAISLGTEEGIINIRENRLSFNHGSFQNIFYRSLPDSEICEIHEKIAIFYELSESQNIFTLAYHYSKTINREKALNYMIMAGEKALEERSFTDALSWFKKALDLNRNIEISDDYIVRIRIGMGLSNSYLGNNKEARDFFYQVIGDIADNIQKADLLLRISNCFIDEGRYHEGISSLKEAYRMLGEEIPENLSIKTMSELFVHSFALNQKNIFIENKSHKTDNKAVKKLKILERLDFIGFWTSDTQMLLYNHFRSLNISRKLGATPQTLRVLCVHLAILISMPFPKIMDKWIEKRSNFFLRTAKRVSSRVDSSKPSKLLFKAVEAGVYLFSRGDLETSLTIINKVMESFWAERTSVFIQEITSIYSQILDAVNDYDGLIELGRKMKELAAIFENPIFFTYANTYNGMGLLFKGEVAMARELLESACKDFLRKNDKVFYAIAGKYLIKAYYLNSQYSEGQNFYKNLKTFLKKNNLFHPSFLGYFSYFIEAESLKTVQKGFSSKEINHDIKIAFKSLKSRINRFPFLKSYYYSTGLLYSFSIGNQKLGKAIFNEGENYFRFRKEPYNKGLLYLYYSYFCEGDEQHNHLKKAYLLLHSCGAMKESNYIEQFFEKEDPALIKDFIEQTPKEHSVDPRTTRELDLILDIGKKIGAIHNIDTLLSEILDQAIELVGAEQGEIIIMDKEIGISITPDNEKINSVIPTCKGVIEMVKEKKMPIIIPNAMNDPIFKHDENVIKHNLKSILSTPLISNDNFLGLIYLSNHQIGNLFTEHQLEMMVSLSGEAAIAIDNALLLKKTNELQIRMGNIINSIPSGIVAVEKSGRILQHNQAIVSLLEMEVQVSDLMANHLFWEAFPELKVLIKIFKRIVNFDSDYEETELIIGKRTFMAGITPLKGNTVYGAVIKLNDVTEERKNLEHMIQVQKMETVSTMVGGLAHDFNNTLTGISASTNYLNRFIVSEDKPDKEEIQESMNTIELAVKRASGLVNQLLTFSMKKEAEVKAIDINHIIQHVINVSKRSFDQSIIFNLDLPDKKAIIMADPDQMEQVVLNIMINASHSMTIMKDKREDWGGTLSITLTSTEIVEESKLKILNLENGAYWRITISDTGVGMDSDTKEKIFEPFFTTKQTGEGTGLGLAMVYSIVRRLNGYLEVYSEINNGTVFNLYFPLLDTDADSIEKIENKDLELKGNSTILIAEDENILRVAIAKSLEACGFRVIQTENGAEAVEYYKENYRNIDFVILDMMMPIMTGQEAYYAMKEINNDILVILTSGFRKDARVEDLLNNGVQYFLQKPYGKNELFSFIQKVLK